MVEGTWASRGRRQQKGKYGKSESFHGTGQAYREVGRGKDYAQYSS